MNKIAIVNPSDEAFDCQPTLTLAAIDGKANDVVETAVIVAMDAESYDIDTNFQVVITFNEEARLEDDSHDTFTFEEALQFAKVRYGFTASPEVSAEFLASFDWGVAE